MNTSSLSQPELDAWLDSRSFYDLMQVYRHASATSPASVVHAFEDVKAAIRRRLRPASPAPEESVHG